MTKSHLGQPLNFSYVFLLLVSSFAWGMDQKTGEDAKKILYVDRKIDKGDGATRVLDCTNLGIRYPGLYLNKKAENQDGFYYTVERVIHAMPADYNTKKHYAPGKKMIFEHKEKNGAIDQMTATINLEHGLVDGCFATKDYLRSEIKPTNYFRWAAGFAAVSVIGYWAYLKKMVFAKLN